MANRHNDSVPSKALAITTAVTASCDSRVCRLTTAKQRQAMRQPSGRAGVLTWRLSNKSVSAIPLSGVVLSYLCLNSLLVLTRVWRDHHLFMHSPWSVGKGLSYHSSQLHHVH